MDGSLMGPSEDSEDHYNSYHQPEGVQGVLHRSISTQSLLPMLRPRGLSVTVVAAPDPQGLSPTRSALRSTCLETMAPLFGAGARDLFAVDSHGAVTWGLRDTHAVTCSLEAIPLQATSNRTNCYMCEIPNPIVVRVKTLAN